MLRILFLFEVNDTCLASPSRIREVELSVLKHVLFGRLVNILGYIPLPYSRKVHELGYIIGLCANGEVLPPVLFQQIPMLFQFTEVLHGV